MLVSRPVAGIAQVIQTAQQLESCLHRLLEKTIAGRRACPDGGNLHLQCYILHRLPIKRLQEFHHSHEESTTPLFDISMELVVDKVVCCDNAGC